MQLGFDPVIHHVSPVLGNTPARVAFTDDQEALTYRLYGREGAPSLLTLHGLVSSVQHWSRFIPHFAQQREVISWDYRGHGGQFPPRDRTTANIPQFADDARAVLDAAGRRSAVVVGLSFGVQVALELYRRHPDRVRALVLVCGVPGRPLDRLSPSPVVRSAAAALLRGLGRQRSLLRLALDLVGTSWGAQAAMQGAFLTGGAHRSYCPPEVLTGLFDHVSRLDPQLVGEVVASYFEHDAEECLSQVGVPTLLLAGDRDQLTPVARAEEMKRAIPDAELVIFPGHSHLVQVERPDEVHAAIESFLARRGL
jgi:pimeloyl-ACP methyl ester carboxylesterase